GGAVAVVEVEKIVIRPFALLDLQAQDDVESLFAGASDPEIALSGLGHLDHPLLRRAGANHKRMDTAAQIGRQQFRSGPVPAGGVPHPAIIWFRHAVSSDGPAARWPRKRMHAKIGSRLSLAILSGANNRPHRFLSFHPPSPGRKSISCGIRASSIG